MNMFGIYERLPMAWDLESFLKNSANYGERIGGGVITLAGVIILIVAGVFVAKKLLSQQDQNSWVKIVVMIILGGAMIGGGWRLMTKVSSGGEKTITDLGGGTILPDISMFDVAAIGDAITPMLTLLT